MNRRVLSKYDIMTVGETPGATVENAPRYAGLEGKELNMVFSFDHVSIGDGPLGKWTTARYDFMELKKILSRWQTGLDGKAWNSLYWANHDQPRTVSRWGDDSPRSAKMLATCLLSLQGTPYIYEGDELGMTNAYFKDLSQYRDIESLNAFHELTGAGLISEQEMMECLALRSRDNARTPVQWDDSPNAGFTTGTPWIAVSPNYTAINAAAEAKDPGSVLNYYKQMIALRKSHLGLVYGSFQPLAEDDPQIFAYRRTLAETGEALPDRLQLLGQRGSFYHPRRLCRGAAPDRQLPRFPRAGPRRRRDGAALRGLCAPEISPLQDCKKRDRHPPGVPVSFFGSGPGARLCFKTAAGKDNPGGTPPQSRRRPAAPAPP